MDNHELKQYMDSQFDQQRRSFVKHEEKDDKRFDEVQAEQKKQSNKLAYIVGGIVVAGQLWEHITHLAK